MQLDIETVIESSVEKSLLSQINKIIASVKEQNYMLAKWYDLRDCYELRGAGSYATFETNRWYQPMGGIAEAKVGGRKAWSRETVIEWLQYDDSNLAEYHKIHKTGAKKR